MLRMDLLRHGETELSQTLRGSTDDALTELGWLQMCYTIDQTLAQESLPLWDVIYSSPLQRCQKFAQYISQSLSLPVFIEPKLQEIHFGDWEGISTQKIYEQYPEDLSQFWSTPSTFTPPHAESIQDFNLRVSQAMLKLKNHAYAMQWTRILVVTHGGVIKLLKTKALHLPLDELLSMSAELGQLNSFEWTDSEDCYARIVTKPACDIDQQIFSKQSLAHPLGLKNREDH